MKFIAWLKSLFTKETAMDETITPTEAPVTDKIKAAVDAAFEAAKLALRHRPLALMTVVAADAIIDALWDSIFPKAQATLTSKGVNL